MATSNNIVTLRRHDLDNLRTWLTGLVIAHHTAVAYGGAGSWWRSACVPQDAPSLPLLGFNAFNQSFFMGTFFGISGRVSAQSLARADSAGTGRGAFVRSKLLRLGLPTLVYAVTVQPLIHLAAEPKFEFNWPSVQASLLEYFRNLRGVRGPLWYTATLLLFDVAAALLKPVVAAAEAGGAPVAIDYRTLGGWGWLPVAGACFLVRLRWPVGYTFEPLNLQPAYAPQYLLAYVLGHMWYDQEQAALAGGEDAAFRALSLRSAALLSLLSLPAPVLFAGAGGGLEASWGGWNMPALAYAVWNEASFAMMGPALLAHFRQWYSQPTASSVFQPRYSYAAFMAHSLVSTVVEVFVDQLVLGMGGARPAWLDAWAWRLAGPVLMTVVVGSINVVASFEVGKLLLKHVPGLNRIL